MCNYLVILPTAKNNYRTLEWQSLTRHSSRNSTSLIWILCLNFPKGALFISVAAPTHQCWRRGRITGALVRLRHAYHPPLLSILLVNVLSLDNKVDKLRVRISFQRDIRDTLFYRIMDLSGYIVPVNWARGVLHPWSRQEELSGVKKKQMGLFHD